MRYNKQELVALASQNSQNFDREGVLVLKEKQDGFFRRAEGCSVRWFRLRGNLLFYLKGPEPWYEPMGVIVLGHHQIKLQIQDENGHWPFQIVWENGVCYRMATFHESERTLWLKAIQMAPYDNVKAQIVALKDRLNRIRPTVDINSYRLQKGIVTDMNEVPLCELALSCDNLLCDDYGRPPSPVLVVYVRFQKGLCIKYGATEVVDTSSNPCFSKTVLFRGSDGVTGDAVVRIVAYDVKERVSETAVPIGFTSSLLSTIQEAQRLRVALMTRDKKTVGFVTINSWSLEPSYIGSSPVRTNDKNIIDLPQKALCHRRSQSLPPRLGLKLKFPSYSTLFKQNFVNSHQVTYRFHSGLGGDITVHEIMAEPKLCYQMPMQLLERYVSRERELLEELLSVGELTGQWQVKQWELVGVHALLLKNYCHAKRSMQLVDSSCFKASCKKDDPSLEFAPVNLHLQRMWVYNDTLNKSGFHDVITVGAFACHSNKNERTGGLIRLVQQSKDMNNTKTAMYSTTANKIQVEHDNVVSVQILKSEIIQQFERILVMMQAKQKEEVLECLEDMKRKAKSLVSLWDPVAVEESLSCIGWPKTNCDEIENQTKCSIKRLTEQLIALETSSSDYETLASTSSSSKETSPTVEHQSLYSSVPNIQPGDDTNPELQFHNDYFKSDREERASNHSFRSVRSPAKHRSHDGQDSEFKRRPGSLRHDYKSSTSLEHVSYRSLIDTISGSDKKKIPEARRESYILPSMVQLDSCTRQNNITFLIGVGDTFQSNFTNAVNSITTHVDAGINSSQDLEPLTAVLDRLNASADCVIKWLRMSHAAIRLRCESLRFTRENAALQIRRDICFAQALTTVTSGLVCWLCSTPSDVVVKVLSSKLSPLCSFEGLLSLYSTEKTMWGDMVVAVEDLQTVQFVLCKVGHSNSSIPQVTGTRLTVNIPISESLYSKFSCKEDLSFSITAVLFNIGVNEKATLAEALGETTPQHHSNCDNLDRLTKYYYKYCRVFPPDHLAAARASSRTKPLEEVMENLKTVVHKKVPKNVEVLHLAALATRLMNGIRFTSCKSAKDRTGMSVTLEQCSILAAEYHLAEHELKKALAIMRSEGCRREITYKNIGIKKFAFTKKQVAALPEEYRPPPGTYGSSNT